MTLPVGASPGSNPGIAVRRPSCVTCVISATSSALHLAAAPSAVRFDSTLPSLFAFSLLARRRLFVLPLGFDRPFSFRPPLPPPFPRGDAEGGGGGSFDKENPEASRVTVLADSGSSLGEERPGPNQDPAIVLELEAPEEAVRISSGRLPIRASISLGCAA